MFRMQSFSNSQGRSARSRRSAANVAPQNGDNRNSASKSQNKSVGKKREHLESEEAAVGEETDEKHRKKTRREIDIEDEDLGYESEVDAVQEDSAEKKRVKRIIRQGIFNAIGEGENPRYIRSVENKMIQLIGAKFGAEENKLGLIPDMFKGISPEMLRDVIEDIEGSLSVTEMSDGEQEDEQEIDEYIETQRKISSTIKRKFKSSTGNIELIHDKNYPPLIIHFPLLREFIMDHQERKSLERKKPKKGEKKGEGTIRADQAKGMTKLISARLMNLYNQNEGDLPPLLEKSSFGFPTPTLADLGDNLSIRLSPGIDKDICNAIVAALKIIDKELEALIKDPVDVSVPEKVKAKDELYKYWGKGSGNGSADVSAAKLMESYNKSKPLLKHLVYTQVEAGNKGMSMIGRILERNHNNIVHLASEGGTLKERARTIFDLNSKEKLHENLNKSTLSSPNLDPTFDERVREKDENGDELLPSRLKILKTALKEISEKPGNAEELASDSEYDLDDKYIKTGKVVVSSGMAALSQLLEPDETAPLIKERENANKSIGKETLKRYKKLKKSKDELSAIELEELKPRIELDEKIEGIKKSKKYSTGKKGLKEMVSGSVYYEDHDVLGMMQEAAIKGYQAKDMILVDLNPNITTSSDETHGFETELSKLNESGKKVWVVDLTSATKSEQQGVYNKWKANKQSTLLITRLSGLKQQEGGHNMNPHGLIHWAHKAEEEGHEEISGFFDGLRQKFPRSRISNEIRRYFKKNRNAYSWGRLFKSGSDEE